MQLAQVTLHPPRCYLLGHRVHHGLIGLALLIHDRNDWRVWLTDLTRRP